MTQRTPSIDVDLFSDEAIADPYPLYREIRDAGALVWLASYDMWAISRFDDVRAALRADSTLLSGQGVAMNPALNDTGASNSLVSDGDEATQHLERRLRWYGSPLKRLEPAFDRSTSMLRMAPTLKNERVSLVTRPLVRMR